MMNPESLLNHFKTRLLELGIRGVTSESINTGGEAFRPAGNRLWFEIAVAPGERLSSIETQERRLLTVTVTAAFPPGIGVARGLAAATRVARLYVPHDPRRGAFPVGEYRFYAVDVFLGPIGAAHGAIRIPVTFRLLSVG
ncbi:MAG: hypothetical protein ACOX6D_06410 [Thermoguttaceae bacterium]|jgi:hypothetical protein